MFSFLSSVLYSIGLQKSMMSRVSPHFLMLSPLPCGNCFRTKDICVVWLKWGIIPKLFSTQTGIMVKTARGIIIIFLLPAGQSLHFGNCLLPGGGKIHERLKKKYSMKTRRVFIFCFFLILYCSSMFAGTGMGRYAFRSLDINNGLSQNTVRQHYYSGPFQGSGGFGYKGGTKSL